MFESMYTQGTGQCIVTHDETGMDLLLCVPYLFSESLKSTTLMILTVCCGATVEIFTALTSHVTSSIHISLHMNLVLRRLSNNSFSFFFFFFLQYMLWIHYFNLLDRSMISHHRDKNTIPIYARMLFLTILHATMHDCLCNSKVTKCPAS